MTGQVTVPVDEWAVRTGILPDEWPVSYHKELFGPLTVVEDRSAMARGSAVVLGLSLRLLSAIVSMLCWSELSSELAGNSSSRTEPLRRSTGLAVRVGGYPY